MPPRQLMPKSSLNSNCSEVVYTHARLIGDPDAASFAPPVAAMVAEINETRTGQWRMWTAEIEAQAQCDYLNGRMDDLVIDFADTLIFTVRDRNSPRVKRYLTPSPYSVVRMALRSEVEAVRSWPESLKTEPEEALSAFAPRFAELIEKADAALAAQRKAQSARLDHRVRLIEPLVEKLNRERFTLYGLLVGRGQEKNLGKHWPDGFFKVMERRSADEPEEPAIPADPGTS